MKNGFREDPIYQAQLKTSGDVVCTRPQDAVDDTTWRRSAVLNEYYRFAEQEEMMGGMMKPPPESGVSLSFINLLRPKTDPRFSVRDRDVLAAALAELRPQIGLGLTPFGDSPPCGVSHRARQIMALLLRGLAEKEVAGCLGISQHTVHDYIRRLHERLQVHSRKDLLASMRSLLCFPPPPIPKTSKGSRLEQVLNLLEKGYREKQIASALGISSHTVHDYIKALYNEYKVHSRAELLFKHRVWNPDTGSREFG